jgi:molecular chaperone DnaJ
VSRSSRRRDYYEVLGVDRRADEGELKRAYREQARRHHPDMNDDPGAEARFKEINEAYAVLSDVRLRARYDRLGFAGLGDGDGVGSAAQNVAQAFDDLFGDLIRRRRKKQRGRDLRYTLEVSFEEAALGCTRSIDVPDTRPGTPPGAPSRTFEVIVPAGTRDGAVRTIRGEGERGEGGGDPGDLNVIVRVLEHPVFTRDGFDVCCEVPVSFPQAALGAVIEVPTIDGRVKMRVPPGTQSGRSFRIRDRGLPRGGAGRGDQRVKVTVEVPTGLTARQRELLEEFARASGDGFVAHPQQQTFLEKVRALFD